MTDLRQAAQAVIDRWDSPLWNNGSTANAIADLRTALEQQQAEPVAWINPHDLAALKRGEEGVYLVYEVEVGGGAPLWDACLPQQQAEPVILNGLTDAETNATASVMGLTKQAEPVCPDCKAAVLYECVACSSNNYPPKQQAEPVCEVIDGRGEVDWISFVPPAGTPLYTAPPQRKELSASEILNMMPSTIPAEYDGELMEFARAVETKIKEGT